MDRHSSVANATCYGMEGPGVEFRWVARFPAHVQTGPAAHSAPVPCFFPGTNKAGLGVDNPTPFRVKVEKNRRVMHLIYFWCCMSWFFGLKITMLPVACVLMKSVWNSTVARQADAKEITGSKLVSLGLRIKQH